MTPGQASRGECCDPSGHGCHVACHAGLAGTPRSSVVDARRDLAGGPPVGTAARRLPLAAPAAGEPAKGVAMRSRVILTSLVLAGIPAFTACVVGDDDREPADVERVGPVSLAPAAAPAVAPPPLLWRAGFEPYLPFTVLDPATHGGSLVAERFLTWPASSLRLTALPVVPGSVFTSARVLLADGLLPDADPSPPLTFGAFDGTTVAPLGGGNGSDVLILGFDAYFEALSGSAVSASVSLTTTTGATDNRLPGLGLPTRQLLHATVVVNRSRRAVRLPDFDADGEIDADESLAPDHVTAYYRTATGAYALARASAATPAAQPI